MMKAIVITGHKKHEIGLWNEKHPALPYLRLAYQQKMIQAVELGAEWFISSGALGLELYAVEWALELRKEYPQIRVAVFLPYYGQEQNWKEEDQEKYQRILSLVDHMDVISKREYTHAWQLSQKNQYLIKHSDGLITFFNGAERTHPWYYLTEARKKQEKQAYQLWVMDPEDLQMIVDDHNSTW